MGGGLTVAEISGYLMGRFPFFHSAYTGWRNWVEGWGRGNWWIGPHTHVHNVACLGAGSDELE